MSYFKVVFWQIMGFIKGFVSALALPITILVWFFGAIGFVLCAGIRDDKKDEFEILAKILERGTNTIAGKKEKKS